jgi:hypothetical protein
MPCGGYTVGMTVEVEETDSKPDTVVRRTGNGVTETAAAISGSPHDLSKIVRQSKPLSRFGAVNKPFANEGLRNAEIGRQVVGFSLSKPLSESISRESII